MREAPLAISAGPVVRAELERVAAAAGVRLDHTDRVGSAGQWRRAPVVLLDAALVRTAAAARLPRREGVVVVAARDLDPPQWQSCLTLGAHRVLGLGSSDDELVRLLADAAEPGSDRPGDGRVLAVVGACGGAGATVLATAVALAAQRAGRPVLLADADPWGAGIDLALGLEGAAGARWGDIAAPSGRLAADVLHRALPSLPSAGGGLFVLGHQRDGDTDVDPGLLDTVLDAARRAGDICVLDLPRCPLPAADRAVARADLTVLVVPADVRGCYGAARTSARLAELGARTALVVRGPSPGGLGADDVAAALGLPLVAGMRPEPGLDRRLDAGRPAGTNPRGPLGRAASAVLAQLGAPA